MYKSERWISKIKPVTRQSPVTRACLTCRFSAVGIAWTLVVSLLVPALFLVAPPATAQQIAEETYWVYFTDKNNNGYRTDRPEDFLSGRSIDRRAWQGLAIDQTDLPVTQAYVDELEAMGV